MTELHELNLLHTNLEECFVIEALYEWIPMTQEGAEERWQSEHDFHATQAEQWKEPGDPPYKMRNGFWTAGDLCLRYPHGILDDWKVAEKEKGGSPYIFDVDIAYAISWKVRSYHHKHLNYLKRVGKSGWKEHKIHVAEEKVMKWYS